MLAASSSRAAARRESATSGLRELSEEEGATAGAGQGEPLDPGRDPLPSWRPQPDGEASQTEEVDGTWGPAGTGRSEQDRTPTPQWPPQGPPASSTSQDFSFIEVSGGELRAVGGTLSGVWGWVLDPWASLICVGPEQSQSGRRKAGSSGPRLLGAPLGWGRTTKTVAVVLPLSRAGHRDP